MTCRLFLVRHGATAANLEGRYIGWEDPPLSPEGEDQAHRLARYLREMRPSTIISSDLTRARLTAEAIGRATGLPVTADPRLREAHFGEWSGLTYEEIHGRAPQQLHDWLSDPERLAPPGGESLAALRSRVLAAIPPADRLVVVTHGGVIRAVLAHLTGFSFWDFRPAPGSVTSLCHDGIKATQRPVTTGF